MELETILRESLEKRPLTNKAIYEKTLRCEFLPKHTSIVFKEWQKNQHSFQVINCDTNTKARKNAFYISYEHYKEKEPKVLFKLTNQCKQPK